MTRDENPWEESDDRHATRRDRKRRPRMPVVGKSVLLLSRIVRMPTRQHCGHGRRRATRLKAPR